MSRRRKQKGIVGILVAIAAIVVAVGQQQGWFESAQKGVMTTQPGQYAVARYVDGDTIVVDMNGQQETVRMIGVDTPETHKPNTPVQCYGPAASAYTKNRIHAQGDKVRLVSDSLSTNRDRYNRLLRYVTLPDGTNHNQDLVAKGYAFAYLSFPFTKSDDFAKAQADAQAQKLGLWGNCTPTLESNGRWQSNTEGS
ncbi:thermonuclease [Candidatus Saccharibacteria bacterium]|nr:MAG: thermonuclease [Candidatus Saccharibacteria bacterium]